MAGEVVLLLGSNWGRRVLQLRRAILALGREIAVSRVSGIFASPPAGRPHQPWFLNVAVAGTSGLSPLELLRFVKEVEAQAGRGAGPRWGPRPLDVDILLVGGTVVETPELVVPHPRLGQRRFFLLPLAQVAPDAVVPPAGRTVRELLAACPDSREVIAL